MNITVNARFSAKKTGIGRVIEQLLCNLQAIDKSNNYYIYVNKEFTNLFHISNPNFHIISNGIAANNMIQNHLWTQFGFQWQVIRKRSDIVIIPGITLILFKFAKTIYFQHDLIEYHVENQIWYKRLFRKFAFPLAIRISDKIVCVSENTRKDVRAIFSPPEIKMELITNAVDLSLFKPTQQQEAHAKLATKYGLIGDFILYTGTLTHPQKNLINLLDGFARLRQMGRQERLVMVGNPGKDFHLIKDKIRELNLESFVALTGYVPDEDLPMFYSVAKVFCFPSLYEGFGLPVLEAMACGCPVITSNTSSLPEVAGDAALMVSPHDSEAIGLALLKVLSDTQLQRDMIERGFAQAKRFSWRASAEKLHRLINQLGGGPA